MAITHEIQQGECLSSVADQYGFFWQTIWNHPDNSKLKAQRKDPNILEPGDLVFVPDKRLKDEPRPTGQMHRFRLKNVPVKLRIQLMIDDRPRAGETYALEVEGAAPKRGVTGPDGVVELSIPPGAQGGTLIVGSGDDEMRYDLNLGQLDPIETLAGVQGRLNNLGFECSVSDVMDERTKNAVRRFQAAHGLKATGEIDGGTRARIQDSHET